jgi:hypothetical protein
MQQDIADYRRQSDIITPAQLPWKVHVIGLGGIGSIALEALWGLGFRRFVLWDDDTVERHNLPNQLVYTPADVGRTKVEAAKAWLMQRGVDPAHISLCGRLTEDALSSGDMSLDGIVISGVDSMTSRDVIWRAVQAARTSVLLYLDGRLGGEQLALFAVRPIYHTDATSYQEWLFSDNEASELPCTARSVVYPTLWLAGFITATVTRWVRRERYWLMTQFNGSTFQITQGYQIVPGTPKENA